MSNIRQILNLPKYDPTILGFDIQAIPEHKEEEIPIPIDTRPISKEEYLTLIDKYRLDTNFMRLPLSPWALEELPEFAETREQIAGIQLEYADRMHKAMEINDIKAQEEALKEKMSKLKKVAKRNKALRKAKAKLDELSRRRAEIEEAISDEEIEPARED